MLVAFLTRDLVFPSRIAGIVRSLAARLETAPTLAALMAKISASDHEPAVVLVDLSTAASAPAEFVPRLKALPLPPRAIIAFGPHVQQEQLASAQAAGCDVVLTRGQFDVQIADILARLAAELSPVPLPAQETAN